MNRTYAEYVQRGQGTIDDYAICLKCYCRNDEHLTRTLVNSCGARSTPELICPARGIKRKKIDSVHPLTPAKLSIKEKLSAYIQSLIQKF